MHQAMADEALAALQSSNEDVAIARMVRKPAVPKPSDLFASDSDDASPPSAKVRPLRLPAPSWWMIDKAMAVVAHQKSAKATASIGDVPAKRDPRPAKAASVCSRNAWLALYYLRDTWFTMNCVWCSP
jgi:hypothetical protein